MAALLPLARGAPAFPHADVAEPVPLPQVDPIAAVRRTEILADGTEIDQLITEDGYCYQFIRTIRDALMGKVKSAIMCAQAADGSYYVPQSATHVAIKQLYKYCVERHVTTEGRPVRENPLQEVAMMAYLSAPGHENVMRLLHFLHDDRCYYIVYEFLDGGELFDQLQLQGGKVPEETARRYLWDTLQGLRYIHGRLVAHRDMSLENAMLSSENSVKLIDFGLAVMMPPLPTLLKGDGRVGKEKYMAPETYNGIAYDGRRVDTWCLGMMLVVLLFGIYPYQVASERHCRYFRQIAEGRFIDMLRAWHLAETVSPAVLDLINRMLKVNPAERISLDDVEAHEWLAPERERAVGLFVAPVREAGAAAVTEDDPMHR